MPEVKYGSKVIRFSLEEREGLKSHYISVEKNAGVVLKGTPVPEAKAQQLILKKARWILNKLALVNTFEEGELVTGSRILYFGRRYYTELVFDETLQKAEITFNHSQFRIKANPSGDVQEAINTALFDFYRLKTKEKVEPRVKRWSQATSLTYREVRFMKLEKRWGSCTDTNNIILNVNIAKLPYTLIDYVIVHELCHTKVKNHSKEFWAELSKVLPNWRELDERLGGVDV
jgi:hypothetical protein